MGVLAAASLLALGSAAAPTPTRPALEKPNIVMLFVDDLGCVEPAPLAHRSNPRRFSRRCTCVLIDVYFC